MSGYSTLPEGFTGKSGRRYMVQKVLQDRGPKLGRVYLARTGHEEYVLKSIPQEIDFRLEVYEQAQGCPHVRALKDVIPEHRIFVFDYLNDNLFSMVQRGLSGPLAKTILKSALAGIAALHDRDIVHNDIKANNIMVQTAGVADTYSVQNVELVDLEDSIKLPPGSVLNGAQLGNIMWRSPEAHAMGPIWKPSDMFSFGAVCVYAMTQVVLFAVDTKELPEGVEPLSVVLERQISLFADQDGFDGLMKYLRSKPEWIEIFQVIKGGFGDDNPRKPFALWEGLDMADEAAFKNLVTGLMNFDPQKRLTAQQALEHEWFEDVVAV